MGLGVSRQLFSRVWCGEESGGKAIGEGTICKKSPHLFILEHYESSDTEWEMDGV